MRVVSWNVNGIRACVRRGFVDFLDRSGADILGVQEVRALPEEIPLAARTPTDWHAVFAVAERRGYSGVGIYSKFQPVLVETSLGEPRFDKPGTVHNSGRSVICPQNTPNEIFSPRRAD